MNEKVPEGCLPFSEVMMAAVMLLWEADMELGDADPKHYSRETAINAFTKLLDHCATLPSESREIMCEFVKAATNAVDGHLKAAFDRKDARCNFAKFLDHCAAVKSGI